MPLVYSGQEAGLNRALAFFEKDEIEWKEHPHAQLFKTLFSLKKRNQALWNGALGGEMVRIYSDRMGDVISFVREKNGDRVLPVINFSNKKVRVTLNTKDYEGAYVELFSGNVIELKGSDTIELEPWGYKVLAISESQQFVGME